MEELSLTGRKNWLWGVNGHNRNYPAYPESRLEDQIRLAAGLGVGLYRINCTPQSIGDFLYLDRVVELCEAYKLKVFLVCFDHGLWNFAAPAELQDAARRIAARYRGRIAMYQLSNEQDIPALDLDRLKDPLGDVPEHYSPRKYAAIRDCLRFISAGIREGDPDAKTVINISWRHTGLLTMLAADGLEWDISGLDWYYDLADHGGNNLADTLEKLCALPAPEVIVAEANAWEGDYRFTEQEQAESIRRAMEYYYRYPNDKLIGFVLYELLDEPDKEGGEGHFGLVVNDPHGCTGRVKPAYRMVASLLGGKEESK